MTEALAWPDLLAALEERTRRLAALVASGGTGEPVPDEPLRAQGPLPDDLRDRARALLAETQRVEQLAAARTAAAGRALHYGRS